MLAYCLKCRKNTESKNPNVSKPKTGSIMHLSKCTVRDSKNPKDLETRALLSRLEKNF